LGNDGIPRILLVDDDADILKAISLLLTTEGYNVVELVSDGSQALKLVQNDPFLFDLIITDYRMPLLDGGAASRIIKSINSKIKIILVSAFDYEIPDEKYFDAILRKPVNRKELLESIDSLFNKKVVCNPSQQ
jgi:CheY-like chemotaxis protein